MLNSPTKNSLDSMKHYSTYQSQFIEMFGSNDCESKPLSDLTSLITKGTTPTSVGFNFEEDGIKYIKAENICEDTSINLNDCMHISQDCHNTLKRSQLQNGDILFSIAGVIGRVGVITKECLPANTNQALAIIRFDTSKEINKEYAKHALLSPFVESQWKMKMRGAAQMNISLKDVGDINIPLPSLAKQEQFCQIAEQADKSKFSSLKSQFIEMFNEKGYPLAMIKSFADVSTGGTPSKANPEYWNGDKPWVSAEDMKNKYVYDTLEKVTEAGYATCKIIPVDTLMYVCRGSIGVMAINKIECATNQSICRAKCHDNVCNVEFLYHALMYQRDNIKKMGTGTSFKSLNQTSFSELKIELPPYNEQMKFVSIAQQADKSKLILLQRMESINFIN